MREIVVCGEALVDVVAATAPHGSGVLAPLAPALGGGPFNVAITVGRLGSAVSFCSAVSTDDYGQAIMAALESSGVGTTLVQRRDEPTSLALATLGRDGAAHYRFYLTGTADRMIVDPEPFAPTVSAVCFGTLSLVLEPGASVYEKVLWRAHNDGRLVLLDPNIRAAVIADADAYRRRYAGWMHAVDIVKLSDEDAAWLAQGRWGSTPHDWIGAGVGAVAITAGGDGIDIVTEAFSTRVAAARVAVADTIGAGDSVLGALTHYLDHRGWLSRDAVRGLRRSDWREAAEFAVKVAGITVGRPGADPPWARELASD